MTASLGMHADAPLYTAISTIDNNRMIRTLAAIAALLAPAAAALAHAGHGVTDPASPTHYVFEPIHAVSLMAVAASGIAVVLVVHRILHRRSR